LRKGQLAIWAIITLGLGWGLFVFAMPLFELLTRSDDASAPIFLMLPFVVQILWFVGGAVYSSRSKRREPLMGILLGFGLEFVALFGLIIFSASSHY
jgi:hypothetical protein